MSNNINLYDNEYRADTLTVSDKWTGNVIATFLVAADTAVFADNEGIVYEWAFPYDGTADSKRAIANFCGYDRSDLRFAMNA